MTEPARAFGDDPGTDVFTVYVGGVRVDPKTLPGYVATGPTVSITEAAKTGDYTIRDDGLIEYVRPMTAQQPGQATASHSPPNNMCVVVCDKTGVVVRIEGAPVPEGVVVGQPIPAAVPVAPIVPPPATVTVAPHVVAAALGQTVVTATPSAPVVVVTKTATGVVASASVPTGFEAEAGHIFAVVRADAAAALQAVENFFHHLFAKKKAAADGLTGSGAPAQQLPRTL